MENASKALTIAANVLLAVMILSLLMYFYNTWRVLPLEEEAAKVVEQAQEFNKQYEVFDKKIMYGVDVLSAVNKAISNNEKYITGSWLSGNLSGNEFAIEIEVILAGPLQEEVDVYYYELSTHTALDSMTNEVISSSSYTEKKEVIGSTRTNSASDITFKDLLGADTKPKFKLPDNEYVDKMYEESTYTTWENIKVKSQTIDVVTDLDDNDSTGYEYKVGSNYKYTLLAGEYNKSSIAEDNIFLKKLVDTISTFTTSDSQVIYNNDSDTLINWSKIEWVPAVSAFKNKKFRCSGVDENGQPNGTPGIQYNEKTGAINKITFVEYTIPTSG